MTFRFTQALRWLVAAAAVAGGIMTVGLVRDQPEFALTRPDAVGLITLLLPGWALVAIGLLAWRRRGHPAGAEAWFAAGGVAWFVAEWNTPAARSSLDFTLGLTLWAVGPVMVARGALSFPGRRVGRTERLLFVLGCGVSVLALGLLPAALADPARDGCAACPTDLLSVVDRPGLQVSVVRVGLGLTAAWTVAAVALLLRRGVTASPALRRTRAAVMTAAAAFLVFNAVAELHVLAVDSFTIDNELRQLRALQAVSLGAVAAAVVWTWTRRGRTRKRVARLVLDLAAAPPTGGLRESLAAGLGDDTLRLGYWLTDGRLVDAAGHAVEPTAATTSLVRGGRQVALLTHRPGLLDDPQIVEEVAAAARLALENERLHAELSAQLEELRRSRQRIIATADASRRRLERDLHDGAQQQLVGLLLQLRLERAHWTVATCRATFATATEVERELQAAVEELRELARGIFPSVLVEEGLAAAVEDFAEDAAIAVTLTEVPERTMPSAVESASYFVVAESVRRSGAQRASVNIHPDDDRVSIDVDLASGRAGTDWVISLEDRVGALDGTVAVVPTQGGVTVRAVIPCG